MHTPPVIALLTDFGNSDGYVAAVKGVILSRVGNATFIDITHEVAPQDIRSGAAILADVVPFLPPHSVVLAVVDPGVGTTRQAIAIAAQQRDILLVGPDNGLLQRAAGEPPRAVHQITSPQHRLSRVSTTFHGRDLFAPAAAHLASGGQLADLGPRVTELVHLPELPLVVDASAIHGTVERADAFGNLISNIPQALLPDLPLTQLHVLVAGSDLQIPVVSTYADVASAELCALVGSNQMVEIARRDGSAAQLLAYNCLQSFALSVCW